MSQTFQQHTDHTKTEHRFTAYWYRPFTSCLETHLSLAPRMTARSSPSAPNYFRVVPVRLTPPHTRVLLFGCNSTPDPAADTLNFTFCCCCLFSVLLGQVGSGCFNKPFTEFPVLPSTREAKPNKYGPRERDISEQRERGPRRTLCIGKRPSVSHWRVRAGSVSGGAHCIPIPQGLAQVPPTCSFLPILPRQLRLPLFIMALGHFLRIISQLGYASFQRTPVIPLGPGPPESTCVAPRRPSQETTAPSGLSVRVYPGGSEEEFYWTDTSPRPYIFFICLKNVIVHDNFLKLITVNKSTLLL